LEELLSDEDVKGLRKACEAALKNAYAPYSRFRVGAAVLTKSNRVFSGCNVENASYPVSICAERAAIASAMSAGEREFRAFGILSQSSAPCPPCGMCRQAISEFGEDILIYLFLPKRDHIIYRISELLPHSFGADFLNEKK